MLNNAGITLPQTRSAGSVRIARVRAAEAATRSTT